MIYRRIVYRSVDPEYVVDVGKVVLQCGIQKGRPVGMLLMLEK